jgi:TatD DNase family protein
MIAPSWRSLFSTMIPLYDAHAHLADLRIREQLPHILKVAQDNGVRGIVANAAQAQDWEPILNLGSQPFIVTAIGIHPFYVEQWNPQRKVDLEELLKQHPSATVGEIGLDAWNGRDGLEKQVECMQEQLVIARKYNRLVSIHNRKTWADFFAILKQLGITQLNGICHNFTGSNEVAKTLLDLGLYLSFCGPITSPNAHRIHKAAKFAPLDRILTETDCPDLIPRQVQDRSLSQPQDVIHVVNAIAEIKNVASATVAEHVELNWNRLFNA